MNIKNTDILVINIILYINNLEMIDRYIDLFIE